MHFPQPVFSAFKAENTGWGIISKTKRDLHFFQDGTLETKV